MIRSSSLRCLAYVFQHPVVLGWVAVLVQELPVKREIDLENRKMFEILFDTIYWQDFFDKCSSGYDFASLGYAALVPVG
ncbi:MAG: hypothetical protein WC600_05970 [Desulfobaccales bacterium]